MIEFHLRSLILAQSIFTKYSICIEAIRKQRGRSGKVENLWMEFNLVRRQTFKMKKKMWKPRARWNSSELTQSADNNNESMKKSIIFGNALTLPATLSPVSSLLHIYTHARKSQISSTRQSYCTKDTHLNLNFCKNIIYSNRDSMRSS